MKPGLLILAVLLSATAFSQDTLKTTGTDEAMGTVTVIKDARLDVLAKKEAEFNDQKLLPNGTYAVKGFRLMLLSTYDRAMAMKVRTQLLQHFPDQKIYMSFQAPYLKLKFGNFMDKDEADKYKNEITKLKLISTNIYIVPEMVEVKADMLNKDKDNQQQ